MVYHLNEDQQALEAFMSEISEKGFSAGWMQDLEYDLWRILKGGDRRYGHYYLTDEDIDRLTVLSRTCYCWIIFDEEKEETAVSLSEWEKIYSTKRP